MGKRLDRKVTFLERAAGKNGIGEKKRDDWQELFPVQAGYEPVNDGERWQAGAVEQKADARFTVGYTARTSAITGDNRLRFEGSDWQITGVKAIGRRRWLELTAWKLSRPVA
ncbi:phage head closure protein [Leisingera sp. M523]|uniref:phage head closure protein n=1 Tax=Leisingera sp. M523 TaxID=2867013 RepID=UPI0021A5A9F4|nr:phage head closure protein [Leisingera sp. M523]UWQ29912.1 phage head closure protein [Leisingera sp. M523]